MRPSSAPDRFEEICSIGPLNVSTADLGPSWDTTSVITRVIVAGSTTRPRIEISAMVAGDSDSTAEYVRAAGQSVRLSWLNSLPARLSVPSQERLFRSVGLLGPLRKRAIWEAFPPLREPKRSNARQVCRPAPFVRVRGPVGDDHDAIGDAIEEV